MSERHKSLKAVVDAEDCVVDALLEMTSHMIVRGPALERWRVSLGLSREALGAAAGGIASATIRRVEREEVRPHPSTVAALVAALNTRSAALATADRPSEHSGGGGSRGVTRGGLSS